MGHISYNANAPRYAAILQADLYLAGTLSRSFFVDGLCVLDRIEAKSTINYPIYNIIWTAGEEVKLKRLVLSWETAKDASCSQENRKCGNRNTKCYGGQGAEFLAEMPLIAVFAEDPQECSGIVKFVDQTTGGIGPYTYDWDFGDGFHSPAKNPSHTYSSPGTYVVGLQVRDRSGNLAYASRKIVFHFCPCTIIGQDNTCLSKTETYRVIGADLIHGSIQWRLDGKVIDDGESIDIDWQGFGAGRHDLQVYVIDEYADKAPRQWTMCNMTITVTPEPVAAISWVV